MCTAVTYSSGDFYFGRTLDHEFSYGEKVVITPRGYRFVFSDGEINDHHHAIIGTAHVADDYPLYYDAVNEKGLAAAGLNFVGNAFYKDDMDGMKNIAQYEFIPWILSRCDSVNDAAMFMKNVNITGKIFRGFPEAARLHWMFADRNDNIVIESMKSGIKIYKNPTGVLTNNPPFDVQMAVLNNFRGLTAGCRENSFAENIELDEYSRGMGAIGLPGDLSSQSRFIRAAFMRNNSLSGDDELSSVGQFFHIMNTVSQPGGCCRLRDGKYEITIYTSCCNTDKGVYYYTTYNNHQITAVDMHRENINGRELVGYSMITEEQIRRQQI